MGPKNGKRGSKKGIRHGGWLWLRKRRVPPEAQDIRDAVNDISGRLVTEFAGPGREPSPAQMILIDRLTNLLGFCKLVERAVWKSGPVQTDQDGQPQMAAPLSGFYIAACNAVVKALKTLSEVSPEHDNRPTIDLKTRLAELAEREAGQRDSAAAGGQEAG